MGLQLTIQSASSARSFRPDIEGLRAVAIGVVVAFHCGVPGFPGGFVGVDVFFVVSGCVITTTLYRELHATATLGLANFYARRIRRLLPASTLMLVTTVTLTALLLAPQDLDLASRAARATALYLSNVFFERHGADYFATDIRSNPLLHMWSLSVEEQFYLCWPVLMLLVWRVWKTPLALAVALIVLSVASFAVCGLMTPDHRALAFYSLPTRAWEFGAGALAGLVPAEIPQGRPVIWRWLGWGGMAAIAVSVAGLSDSTAFPGWEASVPVAGTTAVLLAGRVEEGGSAGGLLSLRPLQWIGARSYSWYVWHWPLLALALALAPGLSVGARVSVACGALGVAAVTHAAVENPIRFHRYLVGRPRAGFVLGAALTTVSLACALAGMQLAQGLATRPDLAAVAAAAADVADLPRQCVSVADSDGVKTCRYGDAAATSDVVLFGDSHALQWFNALERAAQRRGWVLRTYLKTHCPAADFGPPTVSSACQAWRAAVIAQLKSQRPILIVMASSSEYEPHDPAKWQAATRRTLASLAQVRLRVAVIRDTPRPPFDVPTCLVRAARHGWFPASACGFSRDAALPADVFGAEQQGAAGLPGITFIDLSQQLCALPQCPAEQGGLVLYRDASHITGSFSTALSSALEPQLLSAAAQRR